MIALVRGSDMPDLLSFDVAVDGDGLFRVTPVVNGRSLVDMIAEFESSQGWKPAGGYGPWIPAFHNYGDLDAYLHGRDNGQWPKPGRA